MVTTRATTVPTPTLARHGASEPTIGAVTRGGAVARGRGRGRRRTPTRGRGQTPGPARNRAVTPPLTYEVVREREEGEMEQVQDEEVPPQPTPEMINQSNPIRVGWMERDQDAHPKKKVADEMEFAVQCSKCFKWRYIPTEERYEKIREKLLECPFYCEDAREWRPSISCDDIPDITQKEEKLWAFDKPSIPQSPSGWKRIIKIRTRGTQFADVYYDSPTTKGFRSIPEVKRYLKQHPEYASQGVKLEKFSFKTPRSLQQDYSKKRSPTPPTPSDDINCASAVNPISSVPLDGSSCFLGEPDATPLYVPDGDSSKRSRLMGSLFCELMSMMPEAKKYGF